MEVLTTERPTSWPDRLENLDVGEEIKADLVAKNTVRDAAKRVFLRSGKRFSTRKEILDSDKKISVLTVKRVE